MLDYAQSHHKTKASIIRQMRVVSELLLLYRYIYYVKSYNELIRKQIKEQTNQIT